MLVFWGTILCGYDRFVAGGKAADQRSHYGCEWTPTAILVWQRFSSKHSVITANVEKNWQDYWES